MTTKTVHIFAGMSGAGKSTRAGRAFAEAEAAGRYPIICSADNFMRNPKTDEYEFKPQRIGECHNACLRSFVHALTHAQHEAIFVDNTNCTLAEIAPYIAVARAFGVEPTVEIVEMNVTEAYARNVHGVPFSAIEEMSNDLDQMIKTWPPFWPALAGK
jgi:AAA domain-containing protein